MYRTRDTEDFDEPMRTLADPPRTWWLDVATASEAATYFHTPMWAEIAERGIGGVIADGPVTVVEHEAILRQVFRRGVRTFQYLESPLGSAPVPQPFARAASSRTPDW